MQWRISSHRHLWLAHTSLRSSGTEPAGRISTPRKSALNRCIEYRLSPKSTRFPTSPIAFADPLMTNATLRTFQVEFVFSVHRRCQESIIGAYLLQPFSSTCGTKSTSCTSQINLVTKIAFVLEGCIPSTSSTCTNFGKLVQHGTSVQHWLTSRESGTTTEKNQQDAGKETLRADSDSNNERSERSKITFRSQNRIA